MASVVILDAPSVLLNVGWFSLIWDTTNEIWNINICENFYGEIGLPYARDELRVVSYNNSSTLLPQLPRSLTRHNEL